MFWLAMHRLQPSMPGPITLQLTLDGEHVCRPLQFLRLGRAGYTKIMQNCHTVAMFLCKGIESTGYFDIISARDPVPGLPLCTFTLKVRVRQIRQQAASLWSPRSDLMRIPVPACNAAGSNALGACTVPALALPWALTACNTA